MLTFDDTLKIYRQIQESKHKSLTDNLVKLSIRYARIRVDWLQTSIEIRTDIDTERSRAHNALISACDILSRNMHNSGEDITWRTKIGADRKQVGDFACLLHAVLGVLAR
jgi:hypothetical protein